MNKGKIIVDTIIMLVVAFVGLCNVNNIGGLFGFFVMIFSMILLPTSIILGKIRIFKNKNFFFTINDNYLVYQNYRNILLQVNLDEVELEFMIGRSFLHNKYVLKIKNRSTNATKVINCSHIQAKWLFADLQAYKSSAEPIIDNKNMTTIEVVELYNYGSGDRGTLEVFDNYSILNLEKFPPSNKRFCKSEVLYFKDIFDVLLNVKVEVLDKTKFKIYGTDRIIIEKLKRFLTDGFENIIEIVKIVTNNDDEFVRNFSLLSRDRERFEEEFDYYGSMLAEGVFLNWFADEMGTTSAFCLKYFSEIDIVEQLELVLENLDYNIDVSSLELEDDDVDIATIKVNKFLKDNGYKFVKFEPFDSDGSYFLFVVPSDKFDRVIRLGAEIGFLFVDLDNM